MPSRRANSSSARVQSQFWSLRSAVAPSWQSRLHSAQRARDPGVSASVVDAPRRAGLLIAPPRDEEEQPYLDSVHGGLPFLHCNSVSGGHAALDASAGCGGICNKPAATGVLGLLAPAGLLRFAGVLHDFLDGRFSAHEPGVEPFGNSAALHWFQFQRSKLQDCRRRVMGQAPDKPSRHKGWLRPC